VALRLERLPDGRQHVARLDRAVQQADREDELAEGIFQDVTKALIEALELDVSRQRLDSTHIHSDMATFGRTRLMAVTIKRS